ncbi:addiction module protein [Candidatus Sumerlaeota bacterium]|nr:addiction module protein [Candidatus Sumerlaeota bacterium]
MESVEQLARKAADLEPAERLRLVEAILYGLDKIDPNIEQGWVAEAEARYEAFKRGELQAVGWDEIKRRYRP